MTEKTVKRQSLVSKRLELCLHPIKNKSKKQIHDNFLPGWGLFCVGRSKRTGKNRGNHNFMTGKKTVKEKRVPDTSSLTSNWKRKHKKIVTIFLPRRDLFCIGFLKTRILSFNFITIKNMYVYRATVNRHSLLFFYVHSIAFCAVLRWCVTRFIPLVSLRVCGKWVPLRTNTNPWEPKCPAKALRQMGSSLPKLAWMIVSRPAVVPLWIVVSKPRTIRNQLKKHFPSPQH